MIKLKNVFISNFQGGGVAPQVRNSRRPLRRFFLKKKTVCFEIYTNLNKLAIKFLHVHANCHRLSFICINIYELRTVFAI